MSLEFLAADERPHVIGISETKIDSAIDDSHIAIDEYDVIRKDRNSVGGAVALYVHKSVDFKGCDDLINSDIEAISAKIKIGNYIIKIFQLHQSTDHLEYLFHIFI